ncbi:hypothetical protein ABH935_005276 [Catenulispora sp. GAS73]|uniref:hypothetical protein n=1 Tax=Catenulispora sp. GAS73 TaxID=3156269 RepID=UPI003514427C
MTVEESALVLDVESRERLAATASILTGGEVLRLGRLAVEEVERYVAGLPLRYEVLPDQLDRLA